MSFIGNSPKVSTYPTYTGVGNGSTTEYTLSWVPGSANSVIVSVEGVVQSPGTDYTISGDKITFSPAVPNGNDFTVRSLGMPATSMTLAEEVLNTLATEASTQTIWVPAGAMTPRTSNSAASSTVETATNKIMVKTLNFDAAADEFAQFSVRMPKGWNEGTITAAFRWSHAATTTNFAVIWGIQAVAVSDDDALDVAFGTAQTVTDTGGTTDDIYETAATSAVTIANTPAEGDMIIFQVYRDADAGGDTLAVDARLHGVVLYYTTTSMNDA